MSIKQRLDSLTQKVIATGKPKPGKVFVCETDEEARRIEEVEFANVPDDVPVIIITSKDMSLPRPVPKDKK